MIDLGPHTIYIVGAYVGVAIVTFGLIAFVLLNSKKQQARLSDLDARGVKRRSQS